MSEIIILIRWVTPPPKVEIPQLFKSSTLHCLHWFRRFSSLAIYIYIYIWVYVLYNIHLLLFLQVGFLLSQCDQTLSLYAILNPICSQILHVRSIWNSFKIFTVSLWAEEIANGTLKSILSKFSALPLKPFHIPRQYLSIHPRSNTISTSQYVGDTCQANEKGKGHVRPKSSGEQFFTATINTPSPLPHFLYFARPHSLSLELLKP